jgi:hypothetical protein
MGIWKEVRKLAHLPGYLRDDYREQMVPSSPRLVLGHRRIVSIEGLNLPELRINVMDGMGEHYGYPRHQVLLILWWNRRGYAFGVDFVPTHNQTA